MPQRCAAPPALLRVCPENRHLPPTRALASAPGCLLTFCSEGGDGNRKGGQAQRRRDDL